MFIKDQSVKVKLAGGWVPAKVYGLDANRPEERVWVRLATGCQNLVPVDMNRVKDDSATQIPTIEEIKQRLAKSPRWVRRALVVLFERQTPDEQAGEHTGELNGRGFSKFDAPALSGLAKRVLRGDELSFSDIQFAAQRLMKYAAQLQRIAQERAIQETLPEFDNAAMQNATNMRYERERARVHSAAKMMN